MPTSNPDVRAPPLWTPRNPDWEEEVRRLFGAPFLRALGAELVSAAPGEAQVSLALRPDHDQHDGVVHAGVQATLADHTAGTAAATLIGPDDIVLTAEFKINLLRPARGEQMICVGRVLKPGTMLTVAESEVFTITGRERTLVSKATVTLATIARPRSG